MVKIMVQLSNTHLLTTESRVIKHNVNHLVRTNWLVSVKTCRFKAYDKLFHIVNEQRRGKSGFLHM